MPANVPENSCLFDHSSTRKATAPDPETAAAEQRLPSSDHTLVQQTQNSYVIHDMSSSIGRNAIALNNQDVMKMLDDLEDELSSTRHTISGEACGNGISSGSSAKIGSVNTAGQPLLKATEDDRFQGRSWAMGRWKAALPGSHPWHFAKRVGSRAGDASRTNVSTEADDQDHEGANGCADTVEPDEDKWSNVATAADSDVDVEEDLVVATAN
jgi:hypothetical protein